MKLTPSNVARIKRTVCPGCRHDRYNCGVGFCERPGIDAPVTTDKCWHLSEENIQYSRKAKKWYCVCGDDRTNRTVQFWERNGRKPKYNEV